MPEKSILDARLAEIDRRLRTIQSGLAPAAEAAQDARLNAPPVAPPEAAPVPQRLSHASSADAPDAQATMLVGELRALLDAHERLLASAGELLAGRAAASPEQTLSVSAGPLGGTEALRRFEQSLRGLPEVRDVTVREYEGSDRVILDVHLAQPTP
ncbi:MAG: hypothetical protein ACXVSE_03235 [Solirubrobacteraceae bacterium]